MKITKTIEETKDRVIVTDVLCNKCGTNKGEIHNIVIEFGYFSKQHDGQTWDFDLCENCIIEFVKTFKYKPEIKDIFGI